MASAVSYTDLLRFLAGTKRPSDCPICHTKGDWDFHISGESGGQLDPDMAIFTLPNAVALASPLSVHVIECRVCGHMEMIRVERILQWLSGANEEGSSE